MEHFSIRHNDVKMLLWTCEVYLLYDKFSRRRAIGCRYIYLYLGHKLELLSTRELLTWQYKGYLYWFLYILLLSFVILVEQSITWTFIIVMSQFNSITCKYYEYLHLKMFAKIIIVFNLKIHLNFLLSPEMF